MQAYRAVDSRSRKINATSVKFTAETRSWVQLEGWSHNWRLIKKTLHIYHQYVRLTSSAIGYLAHAEPAVVPLKNLNGTRHVIGPASAVPVPRRHGPISRSVGQSHDHKITNPIDVLLPARHQRF